MVNKTEERREAIRLHKKGYFQKDIAKIVKVTEKTVGVWLKPIRKEEKQKRDTIVNLYSRLNELSKNPDTLLQELEELTQIIKNLEN